MYQMIEFFIAILFLIIAVLIKYLKMYGLIAGYNTASAEEKENVDEEKLGNLVGNFCLVLAAAFLLTYLLRFIGLKLPIFLPYAILLITLPYILYKAQKYDHNEKKDKKKIRKENIISIVIILVVVAFIGYTFLPTDVVLNEEFFQVKGLYGIKVPLENISDIQLKQDIPAILVRTNGIGGVGIGARGYYKLEGIGTGKLFLQDKATGPYIMIHYNKVGSGEEAYLIINYNDQGKTRNLYRRLIERTG
ncbi:MAG: DUF3784 domain-containing protein [Halanaerobiales bacterium]